MRVRLALAAGLLAAAAPAWAQDEPAAGTEEDAPSLTANLTLTSDYRFRGQSQTMRDGAVQGGLDYAHPTGLFAGVWASSIDFDDPQQSPAEVDFIAGYAHSFADETAASVWLAYYWYPDSGPADYDYVEILGTVSRDFGGFALQGDVTYSAEYSGKSGEGVGVSAGMQAPVAVGGIDWLTASAQVGRQWIEDNAAYGTPDWNFYEVALTATFDVFAFDLRYSDTDLNRAECFGGTDLCEGGIVLSATATWGVD